MLGILKNKFTTFISSLTKKKEEKEENKDKITEVNKEIKEEKEIKRDIIVTEKEQELSKEISSEASKEPKEKEITEKQEIKKEGANKGVKVDLSLISKIKGIFTSKIKLTEGDLNPAIEELRMNLIDSDVAYETSDKICRKIFERLKDKEINKNEIDKFVNKEIKETLLEILNKNELNMKFTEWAKTKTKPVKIVFFGINGTGKTTTIAKFGKFLLNNNKSVVFAAGDTFRAGAIEQISIHGERLGIKVIKQEKRGTDAAAIIYDAVEYAKAHYIDFVFADTAGRMQTNKDLMNEMKKVVKVMKPDLKVFVADALTGNDAVEQAREFNEAVGIDAVIIAKMDAAKGGCVLSIAHTIQKPIIFMGIGQNYDDIRDFDAKWFVDEMVGYS
ncbi:Signal recognition particle receptor FtsY [groundwater metagenome]|uniref:Signal recognition particle receptor FtsY n=1 Tax=groundwater metagenome TaxID=717931 RepID=A0A098EB48_9ZZZZ